MVTTRELLDRLQKDIDYTRELCCNNHSSLLEKYQTLVNNFEKAQNSAITNRQRKEFSDLAITRVIENIGIAKELERAVSVLKEKGLDTRVLEAFGQISKDFGNLLRRKVI